MRNRSAFLRVSEGMFASESFKKLSKNSNCAWKDHRDKIKVPDPVAKDLISNKLYNK